MKKKNRGVRWLVCLGACMVLLGMPLRVRAQVDYIKMHGNGTIIDSPYVTFSSNGQAWTTNSGNRDIRQYPWGTTVMTGIVSKLSFVGKGQHLFETECKDVISIGKWVCVHTNGQCIHNSYPEEANWCGVQHGRSTCGRQYFSGWVPYCADCGQRITDMLFYMSDRAAASIKRLDAEHYNNYYYLCPFCNNLEQARSYGSHMCRDVSYNQYRVEYDANAGGRAYQGKMSPSFHMYNNATVYEKEPLSPNKNLSRNTFGMEGKRFIEWNTKPDGSGKSFADGAKIYNLTDKDWHLDPEGTVKLYAQWMEEKKEPEGVGLELEAEVKRILEPHTPVFLRGESGILTIITHGYAEKVVVQFPEEIAAVAPGLNHTYYYDGTEEERKEQIQFMVPLDMPARTKYVISVYAYKGKQEKSSYPEFRLKESGESILGELRTRLR